MSAFNDFDARMQESRKRLPPQDAPVRTVWDFAQELRACALGQASASILARHILGATHDKLRALRETMLRMLKENGPPPEGRWADLAALEPVRDYKARHASTLLPFDAVVGALDEIESAKPG